MLTSFFPAHQAKKARPKTLIYLILQDISARSFDIIVHTFSIQFQSILLGFGNCSLQRQSSWGPYNNKPGEKYKGVKKKNENMWVTRGYNTILEKKDLLLLVICLFVDKWNEYHSVMNHSIICMSFFGGKEIGTAFPSTRKRWCYKLFSKFSWFLFRSLFSCIAWIAVLLELLYYCIS